MPRLSSTASVSESGQAGSHRSHNRISLAAPVPESTQDHESCRVTGIVEADETFFLKSAKGSKTLVGRSPRKRGGTAKKKGLSTDEHDAVLIVRDRHGEMTDAVLPDLQGDTIGALLRPIVAKDALLVSDGRAAYAQFAERHGILHIGLVTSRGEYTYGSYHIQNVMCGRRPRCKRKLAYCLRSGASHVSGLLRGAHDRWP